jgi:acyl-CoA synthetase (AMP-forming)/AMP-acid ligase II
MNPNHHLLPAVLEIAAQRFPEKIALHHENNQYTYQKIYQDALLFSDYLHSKSTTPSERVLIKSGNSYLTVMAFWGALFAGFIPCVIDADADSATQEHILNKISPIYVVESDHAVENRVDANHSFYHGVETDLAMIMHTSGSTGFPKGVMLSHRNVIAAIESISTYLALQEQDIILNVLPMHFDYGLYQMLLAFYNGATLVLGENGFIPQKICHDIAKYRITVVPCVPALVQLFFKKYQLDHQALSSVRMVTNTGETLSSAHIEKINMIFPHAIIFSMYGLTECKRCSYIPPSRLDEKSSSIGTAIPNLRMWIVDAQGKALPPGVEGELVISGPTVMLGYWRDAKATAKKIKTTSEGITILHTGDRAVMDEDHFFYFKGRKDYVVKFNGAKLNCHELAQTVGRMNGIIRSHLFIAGLNEVNQLILCVEHDHDYPITDESRIAIFKLFARYQKPTHIFFTHAFPVLSNGKINRKLLERLACENMLCK